MVNRIIEALAVCLADQYGETVTATITKQETKNRKSETEKANDIFIGDTDKNRLESQI